MDDGHIFKRPMTIGVAEELLTKAHKIVTFAANDRKISGKKNEKKKFRSELDNRYYNMVHVKTSVSFVVQGY